MKKNETKSNCAHYDWGETCPRAYGARCNKYKNFFSRTDECTNDLKPQCWGCKYYKKRK